MGYRVTDIGHVLLVDRVAAAKKLRGVLRRAKGNKAEAARLLEVDYRTLARWCTKLADELAALERKRSA